MGRDEKFVLAKLIFSRLECVLGDSESITAKNRAVDSLDDLHDNLKDANEA